MLPSLLWRVNEGGNLRRILGSSACTRLTHLSYPQDRFDYPINTVYLKDDNEAVRLQLQWVGTRLSDFLVWKVFAAAGGIRLPSLSSTTRRL